MNFLVDENMPRSLAPQIASLGFTVQDVRDIGLRGHPDTEVMEAAVVADAIIITRDRGLADPRGWSEDFTAGTIFINLPDDTPASAVNAKILELLANRLPVSLLGAFTTLLQRLNPVGRFLAPFVADPKLRSLTSNTYRMMLIRRAIDLFARNLSQKCPKHKRDRIKRLEKPISQAFFMSVTSSFLLVICLNHAKSSVSVAVKRSIAEIIPRISHGTDLFQAVFCGFVNDFCDRRFDL
ncbi:MAG: DUF5615 family PIN-like protein [Phormidium tanganyikae FI6-MK23]|nr:DUF5615 family PIN-like protein [Phormidium tanganyikae FI6-MK23]